MTVTPATGSTSAPTSSNEDITTIFVVGFPEDMHEREFQNMFMFATGFEAATLKIPACSPEDSGDGSGLAGPNVNSRKQIIGFAKFRTRSEAMKARDILSGRKVDAEKGSVLKAEMAKKNLHTKRGLSDQSSTAAVNGHTSPTLAEARSDVQNMGGFDTHNTGPALASLLSSQDYAYDYLYGNGKTHPLAENGNANIASLMSAQQPNSADSAVMDGLLLRKTAQETRNVGSSSQISRLNAVKSLLDLPDIVTSRSDLHQPAGRTMNDLYATPNSAPMNNGRPFGHTYNQTLTSASDDLMAGFTSAPSTSLSCFSPLPVNVGKISSLLGNSPLGLNPTTTARPSNMGDQNPPCNTLYVGNLAANTNEEELRLLFTRCLGYKRMCFKAKSNGPMCFVEFDDVSFAANALQALQGTLLSNSVKGGIRLSYSKNPLGVRQQKMTPAPLVLPGSSVYIPSGPASAPPTTNMSPFGNFSPMNRDLLGGNAGRSTLRDNWSNISNSPLRDSMLLAPSVGTIGQIPSHTSASPSLLRLGIIASPNTPGSAPCSTDLMFPVDVVSLAYAEMENARQAKEAELRRSDYHLESAESALVGSA